MRDEEVRRFVNHYERLTRHMFADLPDRVDLLFSLDAGQDVMSCSRAGLRDMKERDGHVG